MKIFRFLAFGFSVFCGYMPHAGAQPVQPSWKYIPYEGVGNITATGIGDVNEDGYDDILVFEESGSSSVYLSFYFGSSENPQKQDVFEIDNFEIPWFTEFADRSCAGPAGHLGGDSHSSIYIILTRKDNSNPVIFIAAFNGEHFEPFSSWDSYSAGSMPVIRHGDIDKDGMSDLLFVDNAGRHSYFTLHRSGASSFPVSTEKARLNDAWFPVHGNPDEIIVFYSDTLAIYNYATSRYSHFAHVPTSPFGGSSAVFQLNPQEDIYWLWNNEDGYLYKITYSLEAGIQAVLETGVGPELIYPVAVGYFNNDEIPDIAGRLQVDYSGTTPSLALPEGYTRVAGDLDNDGDQELLAISGNHVGLFLGMVLGGKESLLPLAPANGAAGELTRAVLKWESPENASGIELWITDRKSDTLIVTLPASATNFEIPYPLTTPRARCLDACEESCFHLLYIDPGDRVSWRMVTRDIWGARQAGPWWSYSVISDGELVHFLNEPLMGRQGDILNFVWEDKGGPYSLNCNVLTYTPNPRPDVCYNYPVESAVNVIDTVVGVPEFSWAIRFSVPPDILPNTQPVIRCRLSGMLGDHWLPHTELEIYSFAILSSSQETPVSAQTLQLEQSLSGPVLTAGRSGALTWELVLPNGQTMSGGSAVLQAGERYALPDFPVRQGFLRVHDQAGIHTWNLSR